MFTLSSRCLFLGSMALVSTGLFAEVRAVSEYRRNEIYHEPQSLAVGVNLATSDVRGIDNNAFSFGIFSDYFASPNVSLGLTLDYWNNSFNADSNRRVDVDDLILGGNGKFLLPNLATGLRPFVMAGLAVHRFKVDLARRDPEATQLVDKFSTYDRKTKNIDGELGADFGAGVFYRVQTAMDLVAEAKYRRILDRTVDLDQMNYSVALAYML